VRCRRAVVRDGATMRDVLLGADPPVGLTRRAVGRLAEVRAGADQVVHPGGTVRDGHEDLRWWTWAGFRANATLAATLGSMADPVQRYDDACIRLHADVDRAVLREALRDAAERTCLPEIDDKALSALKFNTALPARLATATLAARLADLDGAAAVLSRPVRFVHG